MVAGARRRASFPSVETVYTPETLPGLGAEDHVPAHAGHGRVRLAHLARLHPPRRLLRRHAARLPRQRRRFGFQQVDYEAIQHFPILREAWVLSLRGRVQTAFDKDGQQIPFFMLPSLGGGSTLRGYSSWRFRDQNSLLLQAEWRIMVNRFLDTAFFYDAGKVAARTVGSRLQRAEERLRLRRPLPRAVRHAAPRRARQEPRRPVVHLLVVRDLLRIAAMSTSSFCVTCTSRRPRWFCLVAALGLFASAVSTQGPRFYPDDPIAREPESQDASKAQPYDIGRCTR